MNARAQFQVTHRCSVALRLASRVNWRPTATRPGA